MSHGSSVKGATFSLVVLECLDTNKANFSRDVEVIIATCDLEEVRAKRIAFSSRGQQAVHGPTYKRIEVDFALSSVTVNLSLSPTESRPVFYHKVSDLFWILVRYNRG